MKKLLNNFTALALSVTMFASFGVTAFAETIYLQTERSDEICEIFGDPSAPPSFLSRGRALFAEHDILETSAMYVADLTFLEFNDIAVLDESHVISYFEELFPGYSEFFTIQEMRRSLAASSVFQKQVADLGGNYVQISPFHVPGGAAASLAMTEGGMGWTRTERLTAWESISWTWISHANFFNQNFTGTYMAELLYHNIWSMAGSVVAGAVTGAAFTAAVQNALVSSGLPPLMAGGIAMAAVVAFLELTPAIIRQVHNNQVSSIYTAMNSHPHLNSPSNFMRIVYETSVTAQGMVRIIPFASHYGVPIQGGIATFSNPAGGRIGSWRFNGLVNPVFNPL